jgi:hypothetical protein
MGAASRRKWTKRRALYKSAKSVTRKLELKALFGHDKRFWKE